MQGRLIEKPWSAITRSIQSHHDLQRRRLMVYKASNRAAVHGSKLPVTDTDTDTTLVNKDEMEKDIQKGKEDKEEKREAIEKAVESKLQNSDHEPFTSVNK